MPCDQVSGELGMALRAGRSVGLKRCLRVRVMVNVQHKVFAAVMLAAGLVASVSTLHVKFAKQPLRFGRLAWVALW